VWLNGVGEAEYRDARIERDARDEGYPEIEVENYVTYDKLPIAGYDRERFMAEHQDFYKEWLTKAPKGSPPRKEINFTLIPTPEVEKQYEKYKKISSAKERDYYLSLTENYQLALWLVMKGDRKEIPAGRTAVETLYEKWKKVTPAEQRALLANNADLANYVEQRKKSYELEKVLDRIIKLKEPAKKTGVK
jgi:hypothetical protein